MLTFAEKWIASAIRPRPRSKPTTAPEEKMAKIRMMDMTAAERRRLRSDVLDFCERPKTLKEVAEKFNLSGISASNLLSNMPSIQYTRLGFYKAE